MPRYLYVLVIAAIYVVAFKLNGIIWQYLRKMYALLSPRR